MISLRNWAAATALAVATMTAIAPATTSAQAYPDRPIRIFQGFAAGGNADTIARLIGGEIAKFLGQSVIVETQTGAGGTIASTTVANARPDGYTLLLATGGHVVAGAIYQSLSYQTVAGFDPVSTITFFPFLLVTRSDGDLRTFADVAKVAANTQGGIAYGTAGVGSTHHLAGELLSSMSKVPMLHVPYRGDTASLSALMANDVPLIIAPPTAVLANIKAGKLRAIATTGAKRWPGLPDVPTVAEQGVAGYDVSSWAGLLAPAGTPAAVIERLNVETQRALKLDAVKSRLEDMGGEARGSSPTAMKAMMASELERWTKVVADAKIPRQ